MAHTKKSGLNVPMRVLLIGLLMKGQGKKRATRARARFRSTAARFDVHKKKRERERERERESDLFFGSSSAATDEKKKPSSRQEKAILEPSLSFLSFPLSLSLSLFEMCLSGSSHYESRDDALFF